MSKSAVPSVSALTLFVFSFSLIGNAQAQSAMGQNSSASAAQNSAQISPDSPSRVGSPDIAAAPASPRPLPASEVMALEAGGALSANLVHDIQVRGLGFKPSADFGELMKKAGADASVLAALETAKVTVKGEAQPDQQLLQQLADAAVLMKNKQFHDAGEKLSEALDVSFARMETGFAMANLLTQVREFAKASAVYREILDVEPDFPEAHVKASFVLYRLGDLEDALNEVKAALAENPNDAEAHKNRGLIYMDERKFDAAIAEYSEALRLKPDYGLVHYDLGLTYDDMHSYEQAVVEYKKSIVLNPDYADAHTNLGVAYKEMGNIGGAITEFRVAKQLNPNDPWTRQNLASALMREAPAVAIVEMRELEKKFPDFQVCHVCLGNALLWTDDVKGAEEEYRIAVKLDPTDSSPHIGLGDIRGKQKDWDRALEEYRTAEGLGSNADAYLGAARMLMQKKDYASAEQELKQGEMLSPSNGEIHTEYAKALEASGQLDLAISEFKEAIQLDPKRVDVMVGLASALEKKGDWFAAMDQYHKAALAQSSLRNKALPGQVIRLYQPEPEEAYREAKGRFADHLVALRAAGKTAEAADLEKRVAELDTAGSTLEKVQALVQNGLDAVQARDMDAAEKAFQQAVTLAEQLPAADENLAVALGYLGKTYATERKLVDADAVFHRELTLAEKTWGPFSDRVTAPLMALGEVAGGNGHFAEAESYYARVLDINLKRHGENSMQASDAMRAMAGVYELQQQYDKAEPYLLRAVKSEEMSSGATLIPLWGLCDLYDRWDKPDKAQPCWHRATDIIAKEQGEHSPQLAASLINEGKALRKLGRNDEAERVEERVAALPKTEAQMK